MEGGKKRKHSEDSPEPLTITYEAPNRTFQRLFKEASLEAMREVVRKKLGVASGTPVNLSRVHDGVSIDLEDDDDFEAFSANARSFSVVEVRVTLGDGLPNGNSTVDAPTRKKNKKPKKTDIAPADVAADSPGSEERALSPLHKKRRVSFVDPSAERREDTLSLLPVSSNGNTITAQPQNSEPVIATSQLGANGDLSEKRKRKKKKKDKTGTDDNISAAQVGSIDEPLSTKKSKKKRRREDAITPAAAAGVDIPQRPSSLPGDNDSDERPAKKSKKKHSEAARDDKHTSKSPPSRSPSSKASDQIDEEAKVASHKVKKAKRNQNATTSGISSVEQPLQHSVGVTNQEEEPTIPPKKKKKEKSKPLDAEKRVQSKELGVPSSSIVSTQAEKEKLAKLAKDRQEKAKKTTVPKALGSEESEQSEEEDDDEPNVKKTKGKSEKAVTNGDDGRSGKFPEASTKSHETEEHVKLKEAAKQSLGAFLARKNHEHSDPVDPPPQDVPSPTESDHSEKESSPQPTTSTKPVAPEPTVEKEPSPPQPSSVPPKQAKKTKAPPPPACPYCDATPFHFKTKCPIINSIVLMRSRLEELRAEVGDDEEKKEQRSAAMTELETTLEKRTHRKPKASTGGAAESTKDKGTKKPKEQRDGGAGSTNKKEKSAGKRKGRGKPSPEIVDEDEDDEEGPKDDDEADKDLDNDEGSTKQAQLKAKVNGKAKPKEQGKEKPKPKAPAKGKGAKQKELPPDEDSQDEDTSDSEANEPQKQVDVVASTPARVVDVQTRSSASPPPPALPSPPPESRPPPSTQPPSTRPHPVTSTPRPSTQPSTSKQPSSLLQTLVKKKVQSTTPSSQELIGLSTDDFSMLGDLSQFTDKDAEALLFPKISIDDVPSSDEEEEKEDKEADDQPLDEDEEEVRVKKPKSGQRYTPSTSDEDEDEDEAAPVNKSLSRSPSFDRLMDVDGEQPNSLTQASSGPRNEQVADLSFKEMDTRGSSREVDKSGNNAVEEAISHDLGPAGLAATINKAMEADSDTAVASNTEDVGTGPVSVKASSKKKQNDKAKADPIEPAGDGGHRAASVDPIVSDDGSTRVLPRKVVEVVIQVPSKNSKPPQSSKVQQDEGVDDDDERKTRSKKRLSELPIPSARMIIAASATTDTPTPKTTRGRKAAAAKIKESAKGTTEDTNAAGHDSDDVPQTQMRTRSAKASKVTPKTPAKPASKSGVTPGPKPSSKSAAAPASTATKTPAKRTPKPPSTASTKKASAVKVTSRVPEIAEEPESESDFNVPRSQWTILQDEGNSSILLKTPGQFDELESPHSLFIHSETQPRFPYSQKFPDTPGSQPIDAVHADADDSDDEDENEVEKSVLKPSTSSSQSRYRGLSTYQSGSQSFATPKFLASSRTKEAEQDLYGREEEADKSSSSSSSDSDEDPPPRKSHIDASRRAGLKASKK